MKRDGSNYSYDREDNSTGERPDLLSGVTVELRCRWGGEGEEDRGGGNSARPKDSQHRFPWLQNEENQLVSITSLLLHLLTELRKPFALHFFWRIA